MWMRAARRMADTSVYCAPRVKLANSQAAADAFRLTSSSQPDKDDLDHSAAVTSPLSCSPFDSVQFLVDGG
jgi:hypothetical protein